MTYIIAEIGSNHLSRLDLALRHIEAAAEAGADAVKFQYFRAETDLARRPGGQASELYDKCVKPNDYGMLKSLELPTHWFSTLEKCARENKIDLMFSCSDVAGLVDVRRVSDSIKIASCDIDNLDLIAAIKGLFRKVIMSTGSVDHVMLENARDLILSVHGIDLTLLYCVSEYPLSLDRFDPIAIPALKRLHGTNVGYSDHAVDWQASALALVQGIKMLERHFIVDKNISSPDACVSSEPSEFKKIVEFSKAITRLDVPLPDNIIEAFGAQRVNKCLRRSPVARRDLLSGAAISKEDVIYLRPGIGLDPFVFASMYVGKRLCRNILAGDYFQESDFFPGN